MEYAGKICPFCKTEFKEGDDIVICSVCEMPHHKECWIENAACTTFGCTGTISGIQAENMNGQQYNPSPNQGYGSYAGQSAFQQPGAYQQQGTFQQQNAYGAYQQQGSYTYQGGQQPPTRTYQGGQSRYTYQGMAQETASSVPCPTCGTICSGINQFCGTCGSVLPVSGRPPQQQAYAQQQTYGHTYQSPPPDYPGGGSGHPYQGYSYNISPSGSGQSTATGAPQHYAPYSAPGIAANRNTAAGTMGTSGASQSPPPQGLYGQGAYQNSYNHYGSNSGQGAGASDQDIADFIGENIEYYINKKISMDSSQTKVSWNWCSFLFSGYWFMYRKLYLYAAIFWAVWLLLPMKASILLLPVHIVFGLFGNHLYLKHAGDKARQVSMLDPAAKASYFLKHGGVSMLALVLTIFISLIIFTVLTAISFFYWMEWYQ